MSEQGRLLAEVIRLPDENGPRLKYAEYLDEQGESTRARFIRVQCELDTLPQGSPRRSDLREEERQLLDQYGWKWAEEFGTEIDEWVYCRGFIERVQMCLETTADKILAVLQRAPIRYIRDTSQFCDLGGVLDALPHFGRLTGLEFWGLYGFENEAVAQLLSSPHLGNLRTLILHHDRNGDLVDEQVIVEALHSPHRAQVEELAVNVDSMWRGPSNAILHAIADSPHLRNLRKLNLSNAGDSGNNPQLSVETIERLAKSANMARLEQLDLRNTHATADVWNAILAMPQIPRLKKLCLGDAREVRTPWIPVVGELSAIPRWRTAFDDRVGNIDWETQIIDPCDAWTGISWAQRRRSHLFQMNDFVVARDYDNLERAYYELCLKYGGREIADKIAALDFPRYEQLLEVSLRQAIDGLQRPSSFKLPIPEGFEDTSGILAKITASFATMPREPAQAIFFRLRPDLNWRGNFHVQEKQPEATIPFEEFGYDFPLHDYPSGDFPEAGTIYKTHPLQQSTEPSGPALYLIARTVATLGRLVGRHKSPVPTFFSCMYAVFRM